MQAHRNPVYAMRPPITERHVRQSPSWTKEKFLYKQEKGSGPEDF